jgi:small-conductance mechanosensitive channel
MKTSMPEYLPLDLLKQLGLIAIIVAGTWIIIEVIKLLIISRLKKFAKKTDANWDDQIISTLESLGWPLYLSLATYSVAQFTHFEPQIENAIAKITLVIVVFYTIKIVQNFTKYGLDNYFSKNKSKTDHTTQNILRNLIQYSLWGLGVIFILQNLGYNLTALLGGLGLAGIAIGFALQNVLGDIFSFFALYLDKPFEVGDFINVGQDSGTVEHMGLKSTRIRTLQGQELVVSNQELTSSRINNYKKMDKRRIEFSLGVTYNTTHSKLKKIEPMIKDIFEEIEMATLDRVHFKTLGSYSLDFEVVYHLESSDYSVYMDTQQEINFQLIDKFNKAKIEFAYPTQEVVVKKSN